MSHVALIVLVIHPDGYKTIYNWFRHFLKTAKASPGEPSLLILDGHYSHTRNIDLLNFARDNGVTIISFQPQDVASIMERT